MGVREPFKYSLWGVEEGIVWQGGVKKGFLEAMATNLALMKERWRVVENHVMVILSWGNGCSTCMKSKNRKIDATLEESEEAGVDSGMGLLMEYLLGEAGHEVAFFPLSC